MENLMDRDHFEGEGELWRRVNGNIKIDVPIYM
jgi:hypothetical protein